MSPTATATADDLGNFMVSSDPTTNPTASTASKLAGDVKGAVRGIVSSAEAAVGTAIGKHKMADEGFEKMTAGTRISAPQNCVMRVFNADFVSEDQRLGAKRGIPRVGPEIRNTTKPMNGNGDRSRRNV